MYVLLYACSRMQTHAVCVLSHAVCVLAHVCCGGIYVGVRGQLLRVGSFLPLPGLWGCNSNYQACVASTSIH